MISSSAAYKAAVVADKRRVLLKAIVDIVSPDITYGAVTASSLNGYSKPEQLYDKVFETKKYETLEHNRWILDGKGEVYPDSPTEITDEVGVQTEEMFGADGTATTSMWVELHFSNVAILQACSVYFSKIPEDGIPKDFVVEVKQGGTVYFSQTFTGNSKRFVSLTGFTVYNPDAIRVTVTRWSLPYRRLRVVEIVPGVYEEWDGNMIASFDLKHQGDVSCLSLPYGTCTLKMDNLSRRFEPRRKEGIFQSIEERQGLDILLGVELPDKTVEYKRAGVFYQHAGGWKTGDNSLTMQWDLVDIIGLLSEREFIAPDPLPATLEGWAAAIVAQLGNNFRDRYIVDTNYAAKPVTVRTAADVAGMGCNELLRYVCMATGTWPRADASTGYLAFEPLWDEGNKITLDNLESYPVMRANNEISAIIFTLNDGSDTQYVVSGSTDAAETKSVSNPFIKTTAQALEAARNIMLTSGGNQIDIIGRGDPASEIGDVDTVWLDESTATTARRIQQDLGYDDGVLKSCASVLLQASGALIYANRVVLTAGGTWAAPDGVTSLRIICVGGGSGSTGGTDGTWNAAGTDGVDGLGANVWSGTININNGQTFEVIVGQGGTEGQRGTDTVFGAYSSASGHVYANGYTDISSGDSFGRTGVKKPLPGTGDGGQRGRGGNKGQRHTETVHHEDGSSSLETIVDSRPGKGQAGTAGAGGCVVIYYNKPV